MTDESGRVICGAKSKRSGRPCRRAPAVGRTRCKLHGGASTGARTPEGKAKAALSLRTHGYYSKMAPMEVEQDLIDAAPTDASLGPEIALARAKVAMLVKAGAGEATIADAINVVRRLAAVENNRTASVPPGSSAPQAFDVRFSVVPLDPTTGIGVRPEDETPVDEATADDEPPAEPEAAVDEDDEPDEPPEGEPAPYCGPCRGPCRCGGHPR